MRILVCPDSFKGSLSAFDAAKAIKEGILIKNPGCEVICVPLADGGEGTGECLKSIVGGEYVECETENIFFKKMTGAFLSLSDGSAFVETAAASGITTVESSRLNPFKASTYGTGVLIKNAADSGAKNIILALGGSATNDGGTGALNALGIDFTDENGESLLPTGENMLKIRGVKIRDEFEKYRNLKFILACDVENPFCGKNGAAYVFSAQKGADENGIETLDRGLENLSVVFESFTKKPFKNKKGVGAAGGLCGGIYSFFDCEIKSGFEVLSEKAGLEKLVEKADLIITGEGRTDFQTLFGKLPERISSLANAKNKRCILISGDIEDGLDTAKMGFDRAYKIKGGEITLENAIKNAYNLLVEKAKDIEVG
ncbi:MAG: glycerate kinase [Clostridia bacterium]|nr:glycerate kinase [Clostridia bacterium]